MGGRHERVPGHGPHTNALLAGAPGPQAGVNSGHCPGSPILMPATSHPPLFFRAGWSEPATSPGPRGQLPAGRSTIPAALRTPRPPPRPGLVSAGSMLSQVPEGRIEGVKVSCVPNRRGGNIQWELLELGSPSSHSLMDLCSPGLHAQPGTRGYLGAEPGHVQAEGQPGSEGTLLQQSSQGTVLAHWGPFPRATCSGWVCAKGSPGHTPGVCAAGSSWPGTRLCSIPPVRAAATSPRPLRPSSWPVACTCPFVCANPVPNGVNHRL